jgi:hypothetical protein
LRSLNVEIEGAIDQVPNSNLSFIGISGLDRATAVLLIANVLGITNLESFE